MADVLSDASSSASRTSRAYAKLHEDITKGRLCPGERLKIEALTSQYGFGATPVREALGFLTADGLVVREDQRGFRVAGVSAAEFEELLHIRCVAEERALRLSIEKGDEDWESRIVVARHQLARQPRRPGYDGDWEKAHRRFHRSLTSASGSMILARLCAQFYDENNRYRHLSRLETSTGRRTADEHEAIAQATLARDTELAVSLLLEHYRTTGELLRRALAQFSNEHVEGPVAERA